MMMCEMCPPKTSRAGARAFERGDRSFTADGLDAGILTDETGTAWRVSEDGLESDSGEPLPRVNGSNAFWFAVANLLDDVRLYEAN